MPTDDHKIIIKADNNGRYSAPTVGEVAIVVAGDNREPRDIIIHRRNNELTCISETHRSYDALQYPIIFWQGENGYHFNIKLIDPETSKQIRVIYI